MEKKEIDVQVPETIWRYLDFESVNVHSAEQAQKLIKDIREAAEELGWRV
jgi:arginine utilization protein RocB